MNEIWKELLGESVVEEDRDEKEKKRPEGPPPSRKLDAQAQPDFAAWLSSLSRYDGEPMTLEEWADPSRWTNPDALHEAEEAAEMFHQGYLEEAEHEVYEAIALMRAAGSAREGGRTVAKNEKLWAAITGQAAGGVPVKMDMGVDAVGDQDDLEGFLGGEGEDDGSGEVDLSKEDLGHVRDGLKMLLDSVKEDEKKHKAVQKTVDKCESDAKSAVLTFVKDEEEGAGEDAGAGAEAGGDEPAGDDGLSDFLQ